MYKKIAVYALLGFFFLCRTGSGFAADVSDPVNSVDKSRLLSTLKYLTASARDSHEAQEAALTWLQENLAAAGVATKFHSYLHSGRAWRNLIATIPENASADPGEERLVVGAHIDTVAGSPGADDNAGGVAAILEAARVLADAPLGMSVDFVFFTNEEIGRIGSAAYARDARTAGQAITGMIAVDMIAYGPAGEDLDLATRPAHAWLANAFKEGSDLYTAVATHVILDDACG